MCIDILEVLLPKQPVSDLQEGEDLDISPPETYNAFTNAKLPWLKTNSLLPSLDLCAG